MEYDGIIEYFDTSLVESGTEQESVPDSVFYDSTESLDFNDSVVELKTITANDEKISSTQQCDQQNSSRSGGAWCMAKITKSGKDTRSYSQRKRDELDYRREYFKHNPGIFGCVWTCAYCHRPIVGKQNVQVDHIMPLNNVLGRNARYNLVAACAKCNRDKSDKVDGRVLEGYVSKLFEVVIFTIQKLIILAFVGIWFVIHKLFEIVKNFVGGLLKSDNLFVRIATIAVLVYVVYFILTNFQMIIGGRF